MGGPSDLGDLIEPDSEKNQGVKKKLRFTDEVSGPDSVSMISEGSSDSDDPVQATVIGTVAYGADPLAKSLVCEVQDYTVPQEELYSSKAMCDELVIKIEGEDEVLNDLSPNATGLDMESRF